MQAENHFQFCFDLSFEVKLNCYIPTSYVVGHTETITYLEKKASSEVLQSMGIETKQLPLATQKTLSICESLQPEVLFKKYRTKSKAAKKIEDLLQDEKLKFGITQFIQLQLASFYALVREHDFPLSFQLGKEKDFRISRIGTQNPALETKLHFDKHENGISYTLKLKERDLTFYPSDTTVTLLLDEPGWLVAHHKLYVLKSINSKKITPFLNKKTVEIPSKLVPDYFEKFIKDIAQKVAISATGFEVITQTSIRSCNLQLVHDFFKNTYFISLTFDYDGYVFDATKTKNTHTEIDLNDLENIKLIQYKRSQAEDQFTESLQTLGLSKQENQLFGL